MPRLGLGLALSKNNQVRSGWKDLVKNCGLLSYNTPEEDRVGKKSRPAIQAETLIGDGITYVKFEKTLIPSTGNFKLKIIVSDFLSVGVDNTIVSQYQGGEPGRFILGVDSNGFLHPFIAGYLGLGTHSISDGEPHLIEFERSGNDFTIKVDGQTDINFNYTGVIYQTNTEFLSYGNGGSGKLNANAIKLTIDNYQTNFSSRDDNGVISLYNIDDETDVILGQQFLSPAVPTEINNTVVSLEDDYGVSVSKALGKNLIDYKDIGNGYNTIVTQITDGVNVNGVYFAQVNASLNVGEHYVLNWETENISGISSDTWRIQYDDNTYSVQPSKGNAIVPTKKTKYLLLYVGLNVQTEANFTKIQLENGSFPTSYEPYKGYTYDQAGTMPVPQGVNMPAMKNGKLATFADGVNPIADSKGRIKYNLTVCDDDGIPLDIPFGPNGYIVLDQKYNAITIADTQRILTTTQGIPIVKPYNELANITGLQLFGSEDKQKILFFEEQLTEGSECLYKTLKFLRLNEVYQVQTAEGSGTFETYAVAEGPMYVLKEGVVIE